MIKIRRGYFSVAVLAIFFIVALSLDLAQLVTEENFAVVKKVPTTRKVVALTIDDGPHRQTTPLILKILREKKVKATFFILGENAERNLRLVAQEVDEGHEVASHGYSHKKLNQLTQAEMEEEIDKTEALLIRVAPKPTLFRPPYGLYNEAAISTLSHKGYTTVLWTVDSNDWRRLGVDRTVQNVVGEVSPGKIILVHDGQYPIPTIEALPLIIDTLRSEGYEFVTMSELLNYYEIR